jgi:threonine/homoserine/homoserine lactone efflux protein
MPDIASILGICGALLLGAASPGPSFVLVARTSVTQSARHGLAAAIGMGLGGVAFGLLALLGLHALMARAESFYLLLRVLGGLYLFYLAYRLWRGAAEPFVVEGAGEDRRGGLVRTFALGLAVQLSNPKTLIVYGSIFAAMMPAAPPPSFFVVLLPLVFIIEAGWYACVAVVFAAGARQKWLLSSKPWIDRAAGSWIGVLGGRIVFDAFRVASKWL